MNRSMNEDFLETKTPPSGGVLKNDVVRITSL
jgi:hypothetical protein